MRRGTLTLLLFIILLAAGASFVVFWPNVTGSQKPLYGINNPWTINEGLDLQGGIRVLLVPKPGQNPSQTDMETTRGQIEQRVNGGLGVNEPSIRLQQTGNQPSIAVELPGYKGNQQDAVQTLLRTGKLEFWNTGSQPLADNAPFDPTTYAQSNGSTTPLFTGNDLDPNSLQVGTDQQTGQYIITFAFKGAAVGKFSSFTANHIGSYLTTTLDRQVITSAVIQSQITGNGQLTGKFTQQQASNIVNLLKYGALPVALDIASQDTISPTLGVDSINRSVLAAGIGIGIVILFMLLYYRLPGLLADIALLLYALVTFAIF